MTKWAVVEDGPGGRYCHTKEHAYVSLDDMNDVVAFWSGLFESREDAEAVAREYQDWDNGDGCTYGVISIELDEPKISAVMEVLP